MTLESQVKNLKFGVTIFSLNKLDFWQDRLSKVATSLGLKTILRGATLTIWREDEVRELFYGWKFVRAWKVSRESYGKGQTGLGVKSVRLYFQGGSNAPTSLPENVLSRVRYKAPELPEERIIHAREFGSIFSSDVLGMSEEPVQFVTKTGLLGATKLVCGKSKSKVDLVEKHGDVIGRNGFLKVPFDFEIILVSENEADPISDQYAGMLASTLEKFGEAGNVRRISFKDLKKDLSSKSFSPDKYSGKAVLVALTGQKGDGLLDSEKQLLSDLEKNGIGFRMFSRLNRQLRFSCFNQVSDLVIVAGGTSYELELPWPRHLSENPFLLGVDLGHPLNGNSVLSVTLCDCMGNLIKGWRCDQSRDETARPEALERLLGFVKFEMKKLTGNSNNPVLVLRDGRLHKGESVSTYRSHLSSNLSFCDLSKRPNIHSFDDHGSLPCSGTAYFPKSSATAYFISSPPVFAGQMTNLQKVHFPQSWDGLGIGLESLVDILIGLSYSPCLGLKPHRSPGPIHWADGFASISEKDCRFRGLGGADSNQRTVKLSGRKKVNQKVPDREIKVFIGRSGKSTGVEGWEDPYRPSCRDLLPKRRKVSQS